MNWIFAGYRVHRQLKCSSNLEKIQVHQTQNFKLENIKNQVEIDFKQVSKNFSLHFSFTRKQPQCGLVLLLLDFSHYHNLQIS